METEINGLRALKNFDYFKGGPLLVCLHGNSSSAETFLKILKLSPVPTIAFDLPGCGDSLRLTEYSMEIIGDIVSQAILSLTSDLDEVYLFGHSLGGHLLTYLTLSNIKSVAISGTPPLSSSADFGDAFKPDREAMKLLPLLSQEAPFSLSQATEFVSHTGIKGKMLDLGIRKAMQADGKFRKGALSTLADKDQKTWLKNFNNVVIFHGLLDGVISKDYLESLDKQNLFGQKIHYLNCQHMTPLLKPQTIMNILEKAWFS